MAFMSSWAKIDVAPSDRRSAAFRSIPEVLVRVRLNCHKDLSDVVPQRWNVLSRRNHEQRIQLVRPFLSSHRSVATLASRLCRKVFGFVNRNLSGAKRRKSAASGERGGSPCPRLSTEETGARRS